MYFKEEPRIVPACGEDADAYDSGSVQLAGREAFNVRNYGSRTFENITKDGVDAILKGLADAGSLVTGANPWDVDTRSHGVHLRGAWNEKSAELTITVTGADWYVPRQKIWENIESLLQTVRRKVAAAG